MGCPADLPHYKDRSLLEYRGRLRSLRAEIERFVSRRRSGLLRKGAAISGTACTVAGGLDWIWQTLGAFPAT